MIFSQRIRAVILIGALATLLTACVPDGSIETQTLNTGNSFQGYGDYVVVECQNNGKNRFCQTPIARLTKNSLTMISIGEQGTFNTAYFEPVSSTANRLTVRAIRWVDYKNGKLVKEVKYSPQVELSTHSIRRRNSSRYLSLYNGATEVLRQDDIYNQQRARENSERFIVALGTVGAVLAQQSQTNISGTKANPTEVRNCNGVEYRPSDGLQCYKGKVTGVVCRDSGACEHQRKNPDKAIE